MDRQLVKAAVQRLPLSLALRKFLLAFVSEKRSSEGAFAMWLSTRSKTTSSSRAESLHILHSLMWPRRSVGITTGASRVRTGQNYRNLSPMPSAR